MAHESILIVDFGSQFTQLIARRLRELKVYCEIHPPQKALEAAKALSLRGIILSGGPSSVYEQGAPKLDAKILQLGVPILGICYGLQWLAEQLGGKVIPGKEREFGHMEIELKAQGLLAGMSKKTIVWMSHGDKVEKLPASFENLASSPTCAVAAVADEKRKLYGIQFHPEVTHTKEGKKVLQNFLFEICRCKGDWEMGSYLQQSVAEIQKLVGEDGEVVLGLSGGVDSAVAGVLIHKAIGKRLHAIFVDNGLLRLGEREQVENTFRSDYQMDLDVVDARAQFLEKLRGVTDPEQKRKVIGYEFVEVFKKEALRFKQAHFLGQGTLYPDVIESVAAFGGPTAKIKSHHNVGGLPEDLKMKLVEPLRNLFKDEVRELGRQLGLPATIIDRQPFPGPGLAVRCLGEITEKRLDLLRRADAIVTEEIQKAGAHQGLWQYFAVLLPVSTVGVMGDARTYENVAALRIVQSDDGMTADWVQLPKELLARISNRIINEVRGINRVVLDISSKPPATIEWE